MAHRLFLLLLLAAATQGALSQSFQSFQLINHDTLHITNCHGEPFRITQSQSTGVLSESLDAYILIETNGVPFDVLTYMTQGNATNRITFKIWDGDSATGTLITDFSGLTLMPTTVTTTRRSPPPVSTTSTPSASPSSRTPPPGCNGPARSAPASCNTATRLVPSTTTKPI